MAIIYPDMYRNTGKDHTKMMTDRKLINVNTPERIFSVLAGTFLLYSGVKNLLKNPIGSASKLLAGGVLFARGASGHCPVYERTGTDGVKPESINIRQQFTVNKPRAEVYHFWRKLENLPLFMRHLESVEQINPRRSKWKASFGNHLPSISWDAEIVKERENEFIGWSALQGSVVDNAGKVEFKDAPDGYGTEVHVIFSYHAPVGGIATEIAKLFNPVVANIIREDILNFKKYIEAGEMPVSQ